MVRFKNRYFLVKLHPITSSTKDTKNNNQVDFAAPSVIASVLRTSVEENFGLSCASKVNPSLSIKWASPNGTHLLIVRCARDAYKSVWSAMTFLSGFPGRDCGAIWQVIHISGTIRSCRVQAVKWHRNAMLGLLSETSDGSTRQLLEESLQMAEQAIKNIEA